MFLQNAGILNDLESCFPRDASGGLVYDSFLHPDHLGAFGDCTLHDGRNVFGTPKDHNNVYWLGNIFEGIIAPLMEDRIRVRIDCDHSITVSTHVGGNAVTRSRGFGREANDCQRLIFAQNCGNGVCATRYSKSAKFIGSGLAVSGAQGDPGECS